MRMVVTAGPTREPIDPVRYISNRSSGRMGYAVAAAARAAGHQVTLVSGPVALRPPRGVTLVSVMTARDLLQALRRLWADCDSLIMAAAVADWRPVAPARRKLKKSDMAPVLRLRPNPDILRALKPRKGGRVVIGFAAETGDPAVEARRKLRAKGLDAILANDVSRPDRGFDTAANAGLLVYADGREEALPLMTKVAMARRIVRAAEGLMREKTTAIRRERGGNHER